ncbi:MAG: hypothetical protein ACXWQR_09345 [Ktedonobacterales bacterium]
MAENPNRKQVVVEDIDTLMHVDTPVYDTYGQKVGEVKQFDLTASYMQVHRGGPEPETFYVPFHLIASIDLRHIHLTVSDATLIMYYTVLPKSEVVLKEWTNWRTGQSETSVEHRMRSGYSGQPVVAFQQNYAALASSLTVGMRVRDIEGDHVGTLQQFDSRQGWMLLVKAGLGADILVVPFSAIAQADPASYTVNLLVPKERLRGDLAALLPSPATPTADEMSQPHADV